ncbi:unnamed protein product [Adineta steineri]|uniref:F-box domain-containing protein n=1 Tax=Adineta steineri TaxID=433720 RepID=A0A816DNK8_9BILA|nr:unnamed protein product [Adineta steineri]CAF1636315.1 unnamed protein product [Adineta steineri]
MKLELLPNEILIECLVYLNTFEIFYSFDTLNSRFSHLIRNTPIYLNFQHIHKTKFSRFCSEILPEIKQNIYSLHLSNKDACGEINAFFSFYLLDDYSHVQSLSLTYLEEENLSQLKSILPLCTSLHSFHLNSSQIDDEQIISVLPLGHLQKLSIKTLESFLIYVQQPTIITHLIISKCSLEQLRYQLLEIIPMLQYLNIKTITRDKQSIISDTNHRAIHLKQLIIGQFRYPFDAFADFVKQTPNLRSLTFANAINDQKFINPNEWENLINASLFNLNTFKFKLTCSHLCRDVVSYNYNRFQNGFWLDQHHWYTELLTNNTLHCIYTVPYISKSFELEENTKRSNYRSINISNIFKQVENLTFIYNETKDYSSFYFPNVISLKIQQKKETKYLQSLKSIVNLSNIKHLDISLYQKGSLSEELIEILRESSQLSSITIDPINLKLLFNDKELCLYMNKIIKKLNIHKHGYYLFEDSNQVATFCAVFSNIQQLRCSIKAPNSIIFLLQRLSKLSTIHVYLRRISDRNLFYGLVEEVFRDCNYRIRIKDVRSNLMKLSIWIDRYYD